ncbi:uncharacterized protein [Ptychodera flava]|uniref:uncharacterized protein isoform X2 n=1 Tax=Ptychodera flava TaxID=63121 RepID=UPI00396A931B
MRAEFVFLCMFSVDFLLLIIQESIQMRLAQPFRCLRAALLLCKLKNVGHIYDVALSITVKMATIFFIIALFIILYAAIGLHLFGVDYHYIGCNNTALVNCTEDNDNIYTGAFDHIGISSLRLFVLLTTENYPEFMLPTYAKNKYSFFYFGLFIYAGVFLLLAIMLAVIVDGYWVFAKKHVKLERSRERAELAKAWNLLDPLGKGILEKSDSKFLVLFRLLRPKNTDDMNQQLIDYLDGNDDGHIDSFEWTTRLNETLSFEFEEDDANTQSKLPRCCQVIIGAARRLVNNRVFSIAILILIIVHSIIFCVRWWGMTYTQELIVQAIRTVIVSIFLIEITLRAIGIGRGMLQVLEILDLVLVMIAFTANIVWYAVTDITIHRGACVVTSSLAVVLRMGFNSAQTKRLVSLLMKIFPVMFDLTILVVIIFYFFSVFGWELFYGATPDSSFDTDYYQYECGLGFQTFPCSLLVIFQVMTTSNWHEIMNATMLSTSEWACLYFIACYFVLELMVMNIFVAIAIEAFNKLGTEKEMEQMVQGEDDVDGAKGTLAANAKTFISNMFESSRHEPDRKTSVVRRGSHISAVSLSHVSEKGSNLNINCNSEEGKEDFSDLPASQRREKMLKQKMAQRKRKHAKSAMTKIIVMTAFKADRENELDLNVGEEVSVIEKRNDWLLGSVNDKTGWLPASHVREMKRTSSMDDANSPVKSSNASPKPAWNRRSSEKADNKTGDSKGSGKGGDHPSFHNTALAAAATTHLQVQQQQQQQQQQSPQQPRLKVKKRETDWRKSILGDITVMNPEEVRELNKIMKSEFKYRGRMSSSDSSGSLPGTMKLSSTIDGSIQEEEGEADAAARFNMTAPGQISSDKIPSIALNKVEEDNGETEKEKSGTSEGKEDMPSWMMRFAESHNISVKEDVKLEKPNQQNEDPSLPGNPNIQTTEL